MFHEILIEEAKICMVAVRNRLWKCKVIWFKKKIVILVLLKSRAVVWSTSLTPFKHNFNTILSNDLSWRWLCIGKIIYWIRHFTSTPAPPKTTTTKNKQNNPNKTKQKTTTKQTRSNYWYIILMCSSKRGCFIPLIAAFKLISHYSPWNPFIFEVKSRWSVSLGEFW